VLRVFRHADAGCLAGVEQARRADPVLHPPLRSAAFAVDRHYLLAPAGPRRLARFSPPTWQVVAML
jgi:hypothetical protein